MLDSDKIREKINGKIKELLEKGISSINASINEWYLKEKNFLYIKEVGVEDNYVMVRLQGAVDAATIPVVQEQHRNYKNQLDKHVVVDFKDVGHIDCSTLATLVDLFAELKSHNKKLAIINATEQLIGYTEILGLKAVISIFANERDAVKYLVRT